MNDIRTVLFFVVTIISTFLLSLPVSEVRILTPIDTLKPAIVFDLGGVLFDTNSSIVRKKQLGMFLSAHYALRNGAFSGASIKKQWFSVLNRVAQAHSYSFAFHNEDGTPIIVKDESGAALPDYMVEWMSGNRSTKKMYDELCEGILSLPNMSATDKAFMINLTQTFLPEIFVASRKLLAQTIALLKSLHKKGYPLYILSNWDRESFELMIKEYPEVFALFDGYIVSGEVKLVKPDLRIYQELERQYPHQEYILIDDQIDNVKAAHACGWSAIKTISGSPNKRALMKAITSISQAPQKACLLYQ